MKLFGQLIRTAVNTALLPVAVVKDIATLGGVANDGYWTNGRRTYTEKQIDTLKEEAREP